MNDSFDNNEDDSTILNSLDRAIAGLTTPVDNENDDNDEEMMTFSAFGGEHDPELDNNAMITDVSLLLFESVASRDYLKLMTLYAEHARISVYQFLQMKRTWIVDIESATSSYRNAPTNCKHSDEWIQPKQSLQSSKMPASPHDVRIGNSRLSDFYHSTTTSSSASHQSCSGFFSGTSSVDSKAIVK